MPSLGKFRYKTQKVLLFFFPIRLDLFELCFSTPFPQLQINYDRNLGNLIVHVLQARNLAPRDNDSYSDPFVKVYLLPGRGWALNLVWIFKIVWSMSPFLLLCLSCFLSLISFWPCIDCAVWNWLTTWACMREWEWIWWHEAVIWA